MRTSKGAHFLFQHTSMNLTSFLNTGSVRQPHYVLFGHPVGHSLSPLMHNTALEHYDLSGRYYAIDLQPDELGRMASYLNQDHFQGANITIPYKQMLNKYLDEISPSVQQVGALNTIIKDEGRLLGENTDLYGFKAPLQPYSSALEGERALIFGTGGAARAVVAGLNEMGVEELYLVSRDPQNAQSFEEIGSVRIIDYSQWAAYAKEIVLFVNATPLGMEPDEEASPVREVEQVLLEDSICYDIVYNPLKTTFLKQAEAAGATTIGGLEMLIHQGSRSFEYWTGKPFPVDRIRKLLYGKFKH